MVEPNTGRAEEFKVEATPCFNSNCFFSCSSSRIFLLASSVNTNNMKQDVLKDIIFYLFVHLVEGKPSKHKFVHTICNKSFKCLNSS